MTEVLTRNTFAGLGTLFNRDTETRIDDGSNDSDHAGWYCIGTDPYECPACYVIVHHLTASHRIVVWPEKDDLELLDMANRLKYYGRNPKVIEYEVSMGPCVSWYELEAQKGNNDRYPHHGR